MRASVQKREELAGLDLLLDDNFQCGALRIAAVIQTPIDRLALPAAIETDQPPGEVVMNRSRRAGRDNEREERQRAIFGAIERILPDATTHATGLVRAGELGRQPAIGCQ